MEIHQLFPPALQKDFAAIYTQLSPIDDKGYRVQGPHIGEYVGYVGGEKIATCARLYNAWPADIKLESDLQRKMFLALYTKHHDGYLRERCLKEVIEFEEPWVPPFILSLLGEYVIEIITFIQGRAPELARQKTYSDFIAGNPAFMALLSARCQSYWDCFYRFTYPDKADYPGFACLRTFMADGQ